MNEQLFQLGLVILGWIALVVTGGIVWAYRAEILKGAAI